ncbi:MAG: hypothetical protein ACD_55C00099G0003 [uncultured bacterium]|uniref:ABC transporter, ATP-binding protein n=1 Tax=Citrifermentans bemidjiense (strain ATCC BAA-1014 / DSM 16622 / JCM 12645 / Bem) TaxID=404380 RepID=B5EGV5_CITBB|nr:ABC transporter ATP-binding protein [Citrifermentans bemidjiense]ACH39588.1 ABC transporter, ATP-binding protein [Citrifermentans bemidjiense Bem]EKD59246.1 MAG: hypothetical protein ACD_55C00099G0003 [uncultured bacterium]
MADTVIQVDGLWKEYRLGVTNHHSLTRDLQSWWAMVRGKEDPNSKIGDGPSSGAPHAPQERFLALRDVSFEVNRGDIVGVIGRNGAGKSTLLKIMSQVTVPTKGEVRIKGRMSSLLEIGTGFHPELTGRENIFLNGSILGMTKSDVRGKLDKIVAFAEIEQFLDTPVKRYSSGMYVRLAFAVAAHLEPEILVVDEVLAVGDLAFQRKCLGKMEDIGKEGRTVLFVSHNMAAVANLCSTAIVLKEGAKVFQGEVAQGISNYLSLFAGEATRDLEERSDRKGKGGVRMTQLLIEDRSGSGIPTFAIGTEISFRIRYRSQKDVRNPRVVIGIYDSTGVGITRLDTQITGDLPASLSSTGEIVCSTAAMNLVPGRFFLNVAFFSSGEMEDYLSNAAFFDVVASDFFNTGRTFDEGDAALSKFLVRHDWRVTG